MASQTLETSPSKKCGGGPTRLLRSALIVFGCGSDGKPSHAVDWGCGLGLWNVVSSIRPLHHPPEPAESVVDIDDCRDDDFDKKEEEEMEETRVVSDAMSSYGSAQDLNKLDCAEDEVEKEEEEEKEVMSIDQRAEEFIERFYEQMRLQKMEIETAGEAVEAY
ncbi:hypothetical protein QJS10_CPB17g01163 [Acorus calamus]|uniref:Uncharacterized protein n=1 Tax=Acorus calamus TaxID=4465 RepID=A0AAV9CTA4_ACOCL|nr:hypothetical protein QJS10_CPB17g01163 [Acorus calamus]